MKMQHASWALFAAVALLITACSKSSLKSGGIVIYTSVDDVFARLVAEQFQQILAEVRAEKKNRKGIASGDFLEFQGRAGLGQAEADVLSLLRESFPGSHRRGSCDPRRDSLDVPRMKCR